ncbi:MAG: ABC transporter permease [Halanaerobiales bacterium]
MKLGEYIRLALTEIYHNKIRTFLTLIGIIIGIAAVILIIFVVQGAEDYIMQELNSIISMDMIQVWSRWDSRSQRSFSNISYEDLDYLEEKLGNKVKAIAPLYNTNAELRYGGNEYDAQLVCTTPPYQQFNDMKLDRGRFLSQIDVENFNNVIVLGYETAENLFSNKEAVGQKVTVYGITFNVIGVLSEAYKSPLPISTTSSDTRGFIPITLLERLAGIKNQFSVNIKAADRDNVSAIQRQVLELLNQRHGLTDTGESKFDAFNIYDSGDIGMLTNVKVVLMILLVGVASITLLVAGIGVMNIMLVIIAERTREIGLRKALGATKKDILLQFIIESIILCIIGGVFGVSFGYIASNLTMDYASQFINLEISVPSWAALLSIGFTTAVGLFFGIYPAAKAARLDPIEALHYE